MISCMQTPQQKESRVIDKQISSWMKDYNKSVKLLLLGAGESGKTTIIKQMKLIHITGFSNEERKEKAVEIRHNVLESIYTLCLQLEALELQLENPAREEARQRMLGRWTEMGSTNGFNQEFFADAALLWSDAGIQEAYELQHRFQLIDCAKYFLDQVETISEEGYIPSDQDILNSRRMTTDIQKIEFDTAIPKRFGGGTQTFWMFDVGGQKGERKKWIQVFDGIQAVLFLVASNSFDLRTREDCNVSRLEDSIEVFQNVWTSRFLQEAGFILFLNKQDKLREKIESGKSDILKFYPEYKNYQLPDKDRVFGEHHEYLRVRCFIRDLFLEVCRTHHQGRPRKRSLAPGLDLDAPVTSRPPCYPHFTTATDTRNVRLVFGDVQDMIITMNMRDIGIQ